MSALLRAVVAATGAAVALVGRVVAPLGGLVPLPGRLFALVPECQRHSLGASGGLSGEGHADSPNSLPPKRSPQWLYKCRTEGPSRRRRDEANCVRDRLLPSGSENQAQALRRAGARRLVALTQGHEVWWARLPGTRTLLRRVADSVDMTTYVSEWCRRRISPTLSRQAAHEWRTSHQESIPVVSTPAVEERSCVNGSRSATTPRWSSALGRMVRRKEQDTLIRAWPEILTHHPDAQLLLVGDGPDRNRLERLTDRRGLRRSIAFLKSVSSEEVPAYVDAGHFFAMPCRSRRLGLEVEAWGVAFLEAQAAGCPWWSATREVPRRRSRARPRSGRLGLPSTRRLGCDPAARRADSPEASDECRQQTGRAPQRRRGWPGCGTSRRRATTTERHTHARALFGRVPRAICSPSSHTCTIVAGLAAETSSGGAEGTRTLTFSLRRLGGPFWLSLSA